MYRPIHIFPTFSHHPSPLLLSPPLYDHLPTPTSHISIVSPFFLFPLPSSISISCPPVVHFTPPPLLILKIPLSPLSFTLPIYQSSFVPSAVSTKHMPGFVSPASLFSQCSPIHQSYYTAKLPLHLSCTVGDHASVRYLLKEEQFHLVTCSYQYGMAR